MLKPYGDMAALITVAERFHALQAETISFSETNVTNGTACGGLGLG
jgi:hypothetical protein